MKYMFMWDAKTDGHEHLGNRLCSQKEYCCHLVWLHELIYFCIGADLIEKRYYLIFKMISVEKPSICPYAGTVTKLNLISDCF